MRKFLKTFFCSEKILLTFFFLVTLSNLLFQEEDLLDEWEENWKRKKREKEKGGKSMKERTGLREKKIRGRVLKSE